MFRRPNNGGGGGGTFPATPVGSVQGNNAGTGAGIPDSSINFTSGIVDFAGINYSQAMRVPPPVFNDFTSGVLYLYNSNGLGGGAVNFADDSFNDAKHRGHARMRVTAVNDIITLANSTSANAGLLGGDVGADIQVCFRVEDLNDGVNNSFFEIGFGDTMNSAADQSDGVTIKFDGTSPNFQYGTRNAGTGSWTASSFPVINTEHQYLRVVVNPAGTLASFYAMNESDTDWTLLGTLAVNIPTGANRFTSAVVRHWKTLGALQREIFVDKILEQYFL